MRENNVQRKSELIKPSGLKKADEELSHSHSISKSSGYVCNKFKNFVKSFVKL